MTVVPTKDLSEEIVVNQFRDPLRSEASDSTRPLTDPEAGNRTSDDAPFVVTSWPDRGLHYPHIVVSERDDSAVRPDRRVDLHEHTYVVGVTIAAHSSTHVFRIRDHVRHWFEDNIETLHANGFEDARLQSGAEPSWESDPKVEQTELVFAGTVNTG